MWRHRTKTVFVLALSRMAKQQEALLLMSQDLLPICRLTCPRPVGKCLPITRSRHLHWRRGNHGGLLLLRLILVLLRGYWSWLDWSWRWRLLI